MATPAPCCTLALKQATDHWPNRNRASDGIMGDAAHQQTKSDHNDGNAFDLTHDPGHGVDCAVLSRQVINDTRITYCIFNRQIYNRARAAEGWRAYTGSNPHTSHMHVSIRPESRNDLANWPWAGSGGGGGGSTNPPSSTTYPGTMFREGSRGNHVITIQRWLSARGFNPGPIDGIFGPKTKAAVMAFQRAHGLVVDGIVGPKTWAALALPVRPPRNIS